MPEVNEQNIAADLVRIHRCLTRGIAVTQEKSQSFGLGGLPDQAARKGFACFVRSLVTVLDVHHSLEDSMFFPYMEKLIPDAPYGALATDHQTFASILPEMEAAVAETENGGDHSAAMNELNDAAGRLSELWHPHIAIEEHHFNVPKLGKLLPPEEHVRLEGLVSEHNLKHAKPDYLVVPFILFNLAGPDRQEMAREFPPIVTEQLIPVAWKDQWAPMKPFLLP